MKMVRFALSSKQWASIFSQQQNYLKRFTLAMVKEKWTGSTAHKQDHIPLRGTVTDVLYLRLCGSTPDCLCSL